MSAAACINGCVDTSRAGSTSDAVGRSLDIDGSTSGEQRTHGGGSARRQQWQLALAAALGIALFGWTIASVGPRELVVQLRTLAPVLPLLLTLAGLRFLLQAAGWRLAISPERRPGWHEAFAAVVAGEAAGYFAWGTVSREPMKAWLVAHRLPQREALAAAVVERTFYTIAATVLILASVGIVATRYHRLGVFGGALAALIAAAWWSGRRLHHRLASILPSSRAALIAQLALAAAQEASNLVEAYIVFAWLGATPALAAVIALEGIGRLLNGAGQFIPGKLGVTEAVTAALADGLQLGATHGLSLALARRVRSLAWGALGIGIVSWRALNHVQTGGSLATEAIDTLAPRGQVAGLRASRQEVAS
jgi:hypothetical protein